MKFNLEELKKLLEVVDDFVIYHYRKKPTCRFQQSLLLALGDFFEEEDLEDCLSYDINGETDVDIEIMDEVRYNEVIALDDETEFKNKFPDCDKVLVIAEWCERNN